MIDQYLIQTRGILNDYLKKIEEAIKNPDSPMLEKDKVQVRLKDKVAEMLTLKEIKANPVDGFELLAMSLATFQAAGKENVRTLSGLLNSAKKSVEKESLDVLFQEGSFTYLLLLDVYGVTEEGLAFFLSSPIKKNKEFNYDLMFFVQNMFKADILIDIVCYNNDEVVERLKKLHNWKSYYEKIKEVLDALPPITIG